MAVNLRSAFLCTHFVLPIMYRQNYGKIISAASQLAYRGYPLIAHYAAAKAAVITFTRSLALEIGTRNVKPIALRPARQRPRCFKARAERGSTRVGSRRG